MEDGEKRSVQAKVGDNLLDIIIEHDVDIDGFGQYKSWVLGKNCFKPRCWHSVGKIAEHNVELS